MNILPMIPVQSQVTQSNCEEAKKLFGKYTLQGLLDELDIIECLKQPGKDPYIGEILTKQRDIYCVMDVQAPESIASLCVDAGM